MKNEEEDYSSYDDGYNYRAEQKQLEEDTFYALTGGQYGDYHDGVDMDDLMDAVGY